MQEANAAQVDRVDPLLSLNEVAERLSCSVKHAERLWQTRQIPGIKLAPRLVRFRPSDIEAYIEDHRVEAVS